MDESDGRDTFGGRLAAELKARGWSLDKLGEKMGTNGKDLKRAAVWAWTHDKTCPNIDQLRLICDRLGVSPGYMIYGSINIGDLNGWEGQLLLLFRKLSADRQHELVHDLNLEIDRLTPTAAPSPLSPYPTPPEPPKRKVKTKENH